MGSLIIALAAGVAALLFAIVLTRQILNEDQGNDVMRGIAASIEEGAAAFLRREYTFIAVFVVFVTAILVIFIDYDALDKLGDGSGEFTDFPRTAIAYLFGAIASASAGYIGMYVAVRANVRTAAKAQASGRPEDDRSPGD